ncbi:hypothetical protein WJX73_009166 [Symbiochloris irregularis]|uniref:Phosphodiesterase n=1 Tax=Symbiochloris irregularis TaxID=706552 RepID=A0AAW1P973_9CHLO
MPGSDARDRKAEHNARALPRHLLGKYAQAVAGRAWRLAELSVFDDLKAPCWVARPVRPGSGLRVVVYANHACRARFGTPRSSTGVVRWYQGVPEHRRGLIDDLMQVMQESIQTRREILRVTLNVTQAFEQIFERMPPGVHGHLLEEALDVDYGGEVISCNLWCLEQEIDTARLRAEALTAFSPIHSMLFSCEGNMLYANDAAHASMFRSAKRQGITRLDRKYTLAELLSINGEPQPNLAQDVLTALLKQGESHHAVTITSTLPDGKIRHTLHEFWPAQDLAESERPTAIVASCFDVTHLKDTELQLLGMKQALQQKNDALETEVQTMWDQKASLDKERNRLREQLQQAVQLHKLPHMAVSTTSAIDLTINLLDTLLDGDTPQVEQILKVRNELLQSADLRAPQDLAKQIKQQKGFTEEAGRSLVSLFQDTDSAATLLEPAVNKSRSRLSSSSSVGPFKEGLKQWRFSGSMVSRLSETTTNPSFLTPAGSLTPCGSARPDDLLGMMPCGPMPSITPEIERLLMDAQTNWDFDMMSLDAATNGRPLSCFAYCLFQSTGLMQALKFPERNMAAYLMEIEAGYRDNPYHNRIHAASVLHVTFHLVGGKSGLKDLGIVEDIMEASMYLAAVAHDYEHPGLTNDFLIRSHNPLAIYYNDRSPLENHHAAGSFHVFFRHFGVGAGATIDPQVQEVMRATVIDLIMATDMKAHFAIMSRMQGAFQLGAFNVGKGGASGAAAASPSADPAGKAWATLSTEHRLLAAQCVLKGADIGHLALPYRCHDQWVQRLQAEWFSQGDRERSSGMPISAMMDREKPGNLASSQVGFFEVVALPLYKTLTAVLPAAAPLRASANNNYNKWLLQLDDTIYQI